MDERRNSLLDELSEEEAYEFLGADSPSPMRRYPPAPDGIKLTAEEARQALEGMPENLSPEQAAEERTKRLGDARIAKSEMALVEGFVRKALGPEPTSEQRQAIQAALGHMYRLGGMFMKSHRAVPMYVPLVQAASIADARQQRWVSDKQKRRMEIIDAALQARGKKPMKQVADEINKELERRKLNSKKPVVKGTLYKRVKTLGQSDELKIDSPSD